MSSSKITQNLFVRSGEDIQNNDIDKIDWNTIASLSKQQIRDRWKTPEGISILTTWKNNKFDRSLLDTLVGRFGGRFDLRGIDLSNLDLSNKNISYIDFFSSNLENSNFTYADLSESFLSESNIKGARFDWAKMTGVYTDSVKFNNKTSFLGVNLNSVNFTLAVLLQDLALSQQRIANLETTKPILAAVLRITCDYGRSFSRFFFWCFSIVFIFGISYFFIGNSLTSNDFWDSLYFSALTFITVTFTIQPVSAFGKILALIESGIGYLMTGLLVAILVQDKKLQK